MTLPVTLTIDAGYRAEVASGSGLNPPFGFDFSVCGAGGGFTGPGTCTINESFSPTAAGPASGTLTVFECPVVGGTCIGIPVPLSGTGVTAASANPPSLNFGNVGINTTVTLPVTLTIDAGYRAEVASGSGLNPPFGFDFSVCGAGGGFTGPGTCTINESFSPTAAGPASGTLTVFECPVVGGTCIGIPVPLSGTGVTAASANPPSLNFGNVGINTTVTLPVTLTIDAGYRAEVASGSGLNPPFGFDFSVCGAGGGFTGPGTCTINESFSPTAAGPASGTLTVFECPVAGGTCIGIPVPLSGTGVTAASANPASINFGSVPINTTVSRDVTLTVDAGYRTEVASGGGLNPPFGFDFSTCGAAGGFTGPGTCTITESFTPTAATSSSGTLTVFECPVVGGTCIGIPVPLSGTGVTAASANPASINFGSVPINTTVSRDVTLTVDAGYRTEVASGGGLNPPFGFDFDACGAGGGFTGPGTCTINESFSPTAATSSSGTLTVFECPVVGGTCIGIPVSLQGTGTSLAAASPNSINFGNVPINTTANRSVTITVDSGYRTEVASGSGINVPFGFSFGTCGAGGGFTGPGTCTITQSFTPTSVSSSSGTTSVFECPVVGGSCLPINVAVQGSGVSIRSANPASVNFGSVPINTTVSHDVTVTVDAGYRTEVASGSGINVPFGFSFSTCGAGGGFAGPGTCTITQSFTPTSVSSSSGTTSVFECPVVGGSCLPINVTVQGSGVSVAAANPASVNFGSVPINTTVSRDVTVTVDAGYRTEVASGSGINVPFGFSFSTCGAGGGFAGPGTCTITQSFTPTSVSSSSGTTSVFECPVVGGSCLPINVTVQGSGVSVAAANPASVNFGSVPINTTVSHDVTVTVDAGYRTEVASGSGINVPFGFSFSTCGAGGGFAGPGTCTITQSFTPTSVSSSSGTTSVFECPVVGGSCLPINVTVQGSGVSVAAANPASVNFGSVPINTTVSRDVTVTVDAGYRTEVASGSGINVPFGFSFSTCGAGGGFAGPGTCTITQSFTPTSVSSSSGTTSVFECPVVGGSCLPINIGVQGSGISVAAANPSSIDFGAVPINTTVSRDVSITVDAGYSAELASGSGINVPFSFDFGTCSGAGGTGPGTCTVHEKYTPTAVAPSSGTTSVFECPVAGGSCLPIPFTEQGSGVSAASANPSSINFGSVPINTSVHAPVTVTVDAGYSVSLASGGGISPPFSFSFGTCSGFSGPGTCIVQETFTPSAVGPASGSLNVFECPVAGGSCIPIPVLLTGSGVSVAAASPASLDFGNVGLNVGSTLPVTVTVDAGYSVSLASGGGISPPFSFSFGTCSGFSGPGTCIVQETFTPSAVGPASGSLNVFECPVAGGSCIPIPVLLTGSGVSVAAASPASLDFGNVGLNVGSTLPVTVTVDAGYSVSLASGGGISPPFSFSFGTCSGFSGPGTCIVQETFTPSAVGPASGSLNVFECPVAGGSCIPIPVSLQGSGILNTTTTAVTSSLNPSNVGQAVTFTATVTGLPGSPPLTGSVTFTDGATTLGTVTLSGGQATLTTSTLPFGTHTITASYSGDASHTPSSANLTQTVKRLKSTTSLRSSDNSSNVGQAVTFTATVKPASGTAPLIGTVTFTDGSVTLGTVALSGGKATLTTSALTFGTHNITASYSGDGTYEPSSDSLTQTVKRLHSSTSLRSSPNPSTVGQAVTFTATVTPSGSLPPTGSVTFTDGSITLGTVALSGGRASLTVSTLLPGHHNVTATYSGDATYSPSSDDVDQRVHHIGTSTRLASSVDPSNSGQAVTFTATVSADAGGPAPSSGTVTFTDGFHTLGTVAISGGTATLTTSSLSPGVHVISAVYSGDATHRSSADLLAQIVRSSRR